MKRQISIVLLLVAGCGATGPGAEFDPIAGATSLADARELCGQTWPLPFETQVVNFRAGRDVGISELDALGVAGNSCEDVCLGVLSCEIACFNCNALIIDAVYDE